MTHQGNRAGRSCVIEYKSAALSTEFGMKMLRAKLPERADAALARLGTYSRGPRKGLSRGYIHWTKVVEGGWHYGEHRVYTPGTRDWCVLESADPRSKDIIAEIVRESDARNANFEKRAWEMLTPFQWSLSRARSLRVRSHEALRNGEPDWFHECIGNARRLIRTAHTAMQEEANA